MSRRPVWAVSRSAKIRCAAALASFGLFFGNTSADTFIYTDPGTASDTDTWSSGEDWTGSTAPTAGSTTTLQFGGTAATAQNWNTTGVSVVSDNDLSGNVNGRFELNQLVASYRGLTTNTAPNNVAPSFTLQGNALEFLDDGPTTPGMTLRANSNSVGTLNQKVIINITNDLYINSSTFTVTALTNNVGGTANTPHVVVTGALNWLTSGTHTLALGGDEGAVASASINGRARFGGAITDHSVGNATGVTKTGTGLWELTGANTYTGGTTILGGTLRSTTTGGMGTGPITVADGAAAWFDSTGAASYDLNITIAGNGTGNQGALRFTYPLGVPAGSNTVTVSASSTITLAGDARIGAIGHRDETFIIDGQITGTGNLTLGTGSANTGTYILSNAANDYVGSTTFLGENSTTASGSSTSQLNVRLTAGGVLSDGDLILNMGTRSNLTVDLRGFDHTVGGLQSAGFGLLTRVVTNGSVATTSESVLTLGANNGGGVYRGQITGSSAKSIALNKIGSGNQVLAGTTAYFGDTTITAGRLTLDHNLYSATQTASPTNQFTTNSTMVLNGGTLAIEGRAAGDAVTKAGTTSGRVFTLGGGEDLSGLVAGQLTDLLTSGAAPIFITGIDTTANTLYFDGTPSPATPTSITTTAQAAGTTSQTFKGLRLSAAAAVNSTIDFGNTDGVILTFNDFAQDHDGSTLTIDNWNGLEAGGGADQLIFVGDSSAFTTMFSQSEIIFTGYLPGYEIVEGVGTFEVVGVPEPASLSLLGLAGLGLLKRRRRC